MILLAVLLGLAGCGGSNSNHSASGSSTAAGGTAATAAATTTSASTNTSASNAADGSTTCRPVAAPGPKPAEEHLKAPNLTLDPSRTYTVTVVTNCGTFAFALNLKESPKTSASFYSLVKRGFFDGLIFHRVVAGFVIEGGDPAGDGSGGPGYTVVEPPPGDTRYVRGDVVMAKTRVEPRGASGSQFFVVTGADITRSAGLTPEYALVGKLVSGQKVVDAIGRLPTNPQGDGAPSPKVVMSSVTVTVS